MFGSVTTIGDSSCWMQESSAANRTAFSLGYLPTTSFGCIIRCAQSGRHLHRLVPDSSETSLDHEVFCLGSTELAPPASVPSLFASLLGGLESVGAEPIDTSNTHIVDLSVRMKCDVEKLVLHSSRLICSCFTFHSRLRGSHSLR